MIILNTRIMYSQLPCDYYLCLNFDDTVCLSHLNIDTNDSKTNLWQIGQLNKPYFNADNNNTNVIITDKFYPYARNNYSTFNIKYLATDGDIYGFKIVSGDYNVQTDSLNDYGKIEFSPDNGITWIDLLNDTVYNAGFIWYVKPILTGNSDGWQYFEMFLADIRSAFDIHLGDTLMYKFTFISDSIEDDLGGIMFDNICFNDFVEGISDISFKPIVSKIYPNPSQDKFTIEFENPASDIFQLSIYNIKSELMLLQENISRNKIVINGHFLKPDIYIYKLTNFKAQTRSWGKFVVTK
jgi:hypothetical protein